MLPNDSLTPKTSDFHSESLIFIGIGPFFGNFIFLIFFDFFFRGGGNFFGGVQNLKLPENNPIPMKIDDSAWKSDVFGVKESFGSTPGA